jgi:mRNA interferase HicA
MKRTDLIRKVEAEGCVLVRNGGKHDWYRNPVTGVSQPVPAIGKSKNFSPFIF